jgi:hypothetical protein
MSSQGNGAKKETTIILRGNISINTIVCIVTAETANAIKQARHRSQKIHIRPFDFHLLKLFDLQHSAFVQNIWIGTPLAVD